ncbi:peptidoglycan DD-metalloendopeptidase family protein [Salipiger marinus]|uniref:peptidoglycan DD-metalloendopeptidase family protein n=1 Tax=Salipiger marinus TaxID=555512 RepID=UPI001E2C4B49|nr:peptidoglycan DD-metalloendopeptidase family protein [Salipiger manganoxidans]MCD1620041.1 M23 family metallopeptidase [Salipiger manganoxidans]MEB3420385.1 peptidoglycan DD-metalloendopeptidase family protein [Salipiger manganoxidans]
MHNRRFPASRLALPLGVLAALAACDSLDYDMRGRMGGSVDTSAAALQAAANRPAPDNRGIISYPNYQVAVARRDDTVATLAGRIGLPAGELARYNGMQPDDPLREGVIIALPGRVSEPSPATGAATTGPIQPPAQVDIATLAGGAIDRAPAVQSQVITPAGTPPASTAAQPQTGVEPIRHKVTRGETAFTIARLYNVTPRALADWNALDANYTLREGQYLLIPVAEPRSSSASSSSNAALATTAPGTGSPTPQPPSASQPLPQNEPAPAAQTASASTTPAAPAKPVAEIGQSASKPASAAAMAMPVQGSIVREYAKGKNEGIDIAAPGGTPVQAAAAGTVAAITRNTDNVQIVVIRHPDELLSIYTHLDGLQVAKGDAVTRGQSIGSVRAGDPAFLHFEVRKGFDSVDPMTYLR